MFMDDYIVFGIAITLVAVIPIAILDVEKKKSKKLQRLLFLALSLVSYIGLALTAELLFVDETLSSYILSAIAATPFVVLNTVIIARRLNDLQHPLILYWLILVPFLNTVFIVYLVIAKSKSENSILPLR